MKTIKVLVVDDSPVFREVISRGISSDPTMQVVATAENPYDASNKIVEFQPDVMTCDVEMPRMNGIEFIRQLMPQHPLPIVVVSSVSKAVFEAMSAGAVDFVTKPDMQSVKSMETFMNELIIKVKIASLAKVSGWKQMENPLKDLDSSLEVNRKLIAIGASTGGTEAISNILKSFPKSIPGIVIVQHIPPLFSQMFAERLNNTTQLYVKEAKNGDYVEQGKVLIAPGNEHMRVVKIGNRYKVECFLGEKMNGHCPSVDILFESMAKEVGKDAIGVILTGMGYDGAKGQISMRRRGARTIGQDEKTCVVYGMPKVAYDIGGVEKQCPLENIPQTIFSMSRG
ncbi:MAG: chemotaxis response regulator protein-glutamate methylesterase [Clostridiales bacterium]|nr:chemotaxis response regulator protein-glutamate methylesterase [Clostridiales bacterium]